MLVPECASETVYRKIKLLTDYDEERARPLIAVVCPFVDRPALNDHVPLIQFHSFAIVQDERESALGDDPVIDGEGAMKILR